MGVIATAARELIAAGLSGSDLAAALERIETEMVAERLRNSAEILRTSADIDETAERRRSKDRERKRALRLRNSAESADNPSPDKEIPSTPPKEINPSPTLASLASSSERARDLRHEFDQFWRPYPHKVGKPAALRAFAKVRKTHDLPVILFGLDRYIAEKPPDRPWLNPATFLNQERFNDQPASPPVANGKSRPHDALFRAIAERFAPSDGLDVGQGGPDDGLQDHAGPAPPDRELDLDLPASDFRRT